jgi:hypothetical protein
MNGPGLTWIFPRIRVAPFIRRDFVVGEQGYSSKYVSGISGLVRDNNNITVGSHIGIILRPEMNSYYVSGIVLDSFLQGVLYVVSIVFRKYSSEKGKPSLSWFGASCRPDV